MRGGVDLEAVHTIHAYNPCRGLESENNLTSFSSVESIVLVVNDG